MISLFTTPSCNFFGPEASEDNLQCKMLFEPSKDHLITACNEGIGRVLVIEEIAKKMIASPERPTWLRHNGSIDLTQLRSDIEMTNEVAKKLLTDEGFVKLSDLHIFDRTALNQWSKACRDDVRCNPCPFGNDEVNHRIDRVIFSPTLALLIHTRATHFNPKACESIFTNLQKEISVGRYEVLNAPEPKVALDAIENTQVAKSTCWWKSALLISAFTLFTIGYLYYARR